MTDDAAEDRTHHAGEYPQYRCTADGRHAYRIMPGRFTEVQRVGDRFAVYDVEALAYPEKVRIHTMVEGDLERYRPMAAEAWEALYREAMGEAGG